MKRIFLPFYNVEQYSETYVRLSIDRDVDVLEQSVNLFPVSNALLYLSKHFLHDAIQKNEMFVYREIGLKHTGSVLGVPQASHRSSAILLKSVHRGHSQMATFASPGRSSIH